MSPQDPPNPDFQTKREFQTTLGPKRESKTSRLKESVGAHLHNLGVSQTRHTKRLAQRERLSAVKRRPSTRLRAPREGKNGPHAGTGAPKAPRGAERHRPRDAAKPFRSQEQEPRDSKTNSPAQPRLPAADGRSSVPRGPALGAGHFTQRRDGAFAGHSQRSSRNPPSAAGGSHRSISMNGASRGRSRRGRGGGAH